MAAGDLFAAAQELLLATDEALELAPGGRIDAPFVSPGMPAFDFTPMLTVHAGGTQFADSAPLQPPMQPLQRIHVGNLDLVQLVITVTRVVPVINVDSGGAIVGFPTPSEMEASAERIFGDLWTIWNHLKTKYRAGDLFDGAPREFVFNAAHSVHAQGGHGGWEIPVLLQLGGYNTLA